MGHIFCVLFDSTICLHLRPAFKLAMPSVHTALYRDRTRGFVTEDLLDIVQTFMQGQLIAEVITLSASHTSDEWHPAKSKLFAFMEIFEG